MMLADVRDYIDSLGIAEHVYMENFQTRKISLLEHTIASTSIRITQLSEDHLWKATARNT